MDVELASIIGLLTSASAINLVAVAVYSWLRQRRSVSIKITRVDGTSVKLNASKVRSLSAEELGELLKKMAAEDEKVGPTDQPPSTGVDSPATRDGKED